MKKTLYNIHPDEVQTLCIRHNYYTAGDNGAYSEMFKKCEQAHTSTALFEVAEDIKAHSHTDDTAEDIAEYIANFCAYSEIVEDDTPHNGDPLPFVKKLFEIQHQAEELARTIARRNSGDDFICRECLRSLSRILEIYETASNPEAREELREELETITQYEIY